MNNKKQTKRAETPKLQWLFVILGLLLLVVIGIGAYFILTPDTETNQDNQNSAAQELDDEITDSAQENVEEDIQEVEADFPEWETVTLEQHEIQFKYPDDSLTLVQQEPEGFEEGPKVILFLNFSEDELSKPQFSLSAIKTDMQLQDWLDAQNYCPDTFESCTDFEEGIIDESITFESINREYGSIDTYFSKGAYIYNFTIANRVAEHKFTEAEITLYENILNTFETEKE
jgi:hypothetical protein